MNAKRALLIGAGFIGAGLIGLCGAMPQAQSADSASCGQKQNPS